MIVNSRSLATTLFHSAISKLLFFVYALSLQSSLTSAHSQSPNTSNHVNNDQSDNVIVGIIWHNAEPQVISIKTTSSRLSPDRSFGMNTIDEAEVRGAMIIKGPAGAECMIGTSPYDGGNEFTDVVRYVGLANASFVACVVVEPLADAEFVEQEDDAVSTSRAGEGEVDNANSLRIDDLNTDDDFGSWLDDITDIGTSDAVADFENEEWRTNDNDDDDDEDDYDWDLV